MTTFRLVVAAGPPRVEIGSYGCGLATARRVDFGSRKVVWRAGNIRKVDRTCDNGISYVTDTTCDNRVIYVTDRTYGYGNIYTKPAPDGS